MLAPAADAGYNCGWMVLCAGSACVVVVRLGGDGRLLCRWMDRICFRAGGEDLLHHVLGGASAIANQSVCCRRLVGALLGRLSSVAGNTGKCARGLSPDQQLRTSRVPVQNIIALLRKRRVLGGTQPKRVRHVRCFGEFCVCGSIVPVCNLIQKKEKKEKE